ncbi:MmgE/PrpD family protein [Picrophilus oshimae]|uniref:2-methylisocitrate synthase n=1 Tax=Picrophilus torridus (strain ATCC 700027 / DSM 9790 / JCM 10055 / NBRC 100828 / KAW 2/3) TaxID=1122961 RepID=Q6L2P6_PICTO|nr:MmgE/PrpD family protein [Picrophilus oshimae]AAT42756.1 2-methylisocitrate synthase [Picrophilus oshimae DSM 9789]
MIEDKIADFVVRSKYEDLDDDTVNEIKKRFVDAVGVAYASMDSPAYNAIKHLADYSQGNALTFGIKNTEPGLSAFINSLLIRYLDFNDTYLSLEPLHPSDMFGTIISAASLFKKTGRDIIKAAAVGYAVSMKFCDSTTLRKKGYDHVNFTEIGMAAALSSLLNFDIDQTINTISIALVPHIALRESRVGSLTMWKAGATAESSRNSIFAALATLHGFTSTKTPLSGELGFVNIIARDINKNVFDDLDVNYMKKTYIKKYPVEYHAQAAVDASLYLSNKISVDKIKKIDVYTYEAAISILADKGKWNPENKETADHSLPFIIASTMINRSFWLENYNINEYRKAHDLMKKINIIEDYKYTNEYPEKLPIKIVINDDIEKYIDIPEGHYKRPMSLSSIEEKFIKLTNNKKLLDKLWHLDSMEAIEIE